MTDFSALLHGIAALLWPVILLFILWRFAPAVTSIIESARSRKFTLKVGGQELTMEEVRAQQSNLIGDLQAQVAELKEAHAHLDAPAVPPSKSGIATSPSTTRLAPPRVLWVDDQPKNNSHIVEQLRRGGIEVDLASTTSEGLSLLERHDYRAVVSDIGRHEGLTYNRDAGFEFLRQAHDAVPDLPFALFTSLAGVTHRRKQALAGGAHLITTSATELVQFLRRHLPEWNNLI